MSMQFSASGCQELEHIPSASGIVVDQGLFYVIGDDSPWLFVLDVHFEVQDKTLLFPDEELPKHGVYKKKRKHDLEALTMMDVDGRPVVVAIGSGSKSPKRDVWVEVDVLNQSEAVQYDLNPFYQSLQLSTGLTTKQLNIEAAEVVGHSLVLFNRGMNLIFQFNLVALIDHVHGLTRYPEPSIYRVSLPELKGVETGFSGASVVPGTTQVIFTASAERTSNWIADGEIVGSVIGYFDLETLVDGAQLEAVPIFTPTGETRIKVESVAVLPTSTKSQIDLVLVSDGDGGPSLVITGRLDHWA